MRTARYPGVTTYVTGTTADANTIAAAARQDVASGRAVNILFEHKGEVALVSRIMRTGHGYHVGHGSQPASRHAEASHAVATALSDLERREREMMNPKHARLGSGQ